MNRTIKPVNIIIVEPNHIVEEEAQIIVETPVSLTVNGEVWLSFMCTPIDVTAMAVGFLFNEGLITRLDEIADVRLCPTGDNVDVWTNQPLEKPEAWRRTSGCTGGLTAVALENPPELEQSPMPLNGILVTPDQVTELIGKLFSSQSLYQKAGGVHTSALCDGDRLIVVAEDIGRHNTLDKIAGRCLMEGIQFSKGILLTTGRISSEMLQKAARIGAAIVISRTSPSSLSIELAERRGITLIGYARRDRFRLYTHPERILTILDREGVADA